MSVRFIVGVPTYNNEATISETIAVFEEQTVSPTELVFCDASDDRTPEILREHAERVDDFEITVLEQEGDGVADAYNQLLAYAGERDYDIFGTLQTRYRLPETWVERAIEIHEAHPDVDLVNNADGIHEQVGPDHPAYFAGRCFTAKAGVLESVDGWDENFLRGEDWDIRIRLTSQGATAFATEELSYEPIADDPPISLSKARRKPTSVTFLWKYGLWYARYHPSHVIADGLAAGLIAGLILIALTPLSVFLGAVGAVLAAGSAVAYNLGHHLTRGSVHGSHLVGPVRKQFLDGVGVVSALARLTGSDPDWNLTGFDPSQVPRYRF